MLQLAAVHWDAHVPQVPRIPLAARAADAQEACSTPLAAIVFTAFWPLLHHRFWRQQSRFGAPTTMVQPRRLRHRALAMAAGTDCGWRGAETVAVDALHSIGQSGATASSSQRPVHSSLTTDSQARLHYPSDAGGVKEIDLDGMD